MKSDIQLAHSYDYDLKNYPDSTRAGKSEISRKNKQIKIKFMKLNNNILNSYK